MKRASGSNTLIRAKSSGFQGAPCGQAPGSADDFFLRNKAAKRGALRSQPSLPSFQGGRTGLERLCNINAHHRQIEIDKRGTHWISGSEWDEIRVQVEGLAADSAAMQLLAPEQRKAVNDMANAFALGLRGGSLHKPWRELRVQLPREGDAAVKRVRMVDSFTGPLHADKTGQHTLKELCPRILSYPHSWTAEILASTSQLQQQLGRGDLSAASGTRRTLLAQLNAFKATATPGAAQSQRTSPSSRTRPAQRVAPRTVGHTRPRLSRDESNAVMSFQRVLKKLLDGNVRMQVDEDQLTNLCLAQRNRPEVWGDRLCQLMRDVVNESMVQGSKTMGSHMRALLDGINHFAGGSQGK